jgi:glycosyltransferase involved in cell wall biosynthesis
MIYRRKPAMRIVFLSNLGTHLDEGQKNIAVHLHRRLSRRHQVQHYNAKRSLGAPAVWRALRRFAPQVVHVLLRPNAAVLAYSRMMGLYTGARVVVSALQPPSHLGHARKVLRWWKPDLILSQSPETHDFFVRAGCKTEFLWGGVDLQKFSPVETSGKTRLREKYGLPRQAFILLHAGHLRRGRNLEILGSLQGSDIQGVVAVSPAFPAEPQVERQLAAAGCYLIKGFIPEIQELYQLADAYLFPTRDSASSIELPLSVLEAMACNLPVFTAKCGVLPLLFLQGRGLTYISGDPDLTPEKIKELARQPDVATREMVAAFSWESMGERLEGLYRDLLSNREL